MESLREQFRPDIDGMSEADAIDRWEYASALADAGGSSLHEIRAEKKRRKNPLGAEPHEDVADVPGPADPVRAYAQEVAALRGEVRALRADAAVIASAPRKGKPDKQPWHFSKLLGAGRGKQRYRKGAP
jgi:hypothetical protein